MRLPGTVLFTEEAVGGKADAKNDTNCNVDERGPSLRVLVLSSPAEHFVLDIKSSLFQRQFLSNFTTLDLCCCTATACGAEPLTSALAKDPEPLLRNLTDLELTCSPTQSSILRQLSCTVGSKLAGVDIDRLRQGTLGRTLSQREWQHRLRFAATKSFGLIVQAMHTL